MTSTRSVSLDQIETDLQLNAPLSWLTQVHGNKLLALTAHNTSRPEADGSYTQKPGVVCVVKTADCLPVLLTNQAGDFAAALHCGWRGLYEGIIEHAVSLVKNRESLLAWIGPGISQKNYEVDDAFYKRFYQKDEAYAAAFQARNGNYLADLSQIAEYQLLKQGVGSVFQSEICSFEDTKRCHSYRREGEQSGRMATLIWLDNL
jgi:YfiH family protein